MPLIRELPTLYFSRLTVPIVENRLTLTSDNVDKDLEKFLEKSFPKEVRAKRIEIETAAGIE